MSVVGDARCTRERPPVSLRDGSLLPGDTEEGFVGQEHDDEVGRMTELLPVAYLALSFAM